MIIQKISFIVVLSYMYVILYCEQLEYFNEMCQCTGIKGKN